jgi:hypothetical protein
VAAVQYTFADWYKTPWDKIDVDFLVEETKKLAKVNVHSELHLMSYSRRDAPGSSAGPRCYCSCAMEHG